MKKRTTIILLLLTFAIYASNFNVNITAEENTSRPTSLELTPHDPILITSDSDFEVFPGTGTAEDPYIIEDYNITTTIQKGIYIDGTTKYFIIHNCYVDASNYGIYIFYVADGTATVANNTCNNNNNRGIYLWYSGSSTVENNTCNNNNEYGIYLGNSDYSTVTNNTCNNNDGGIFIFSSVGSTVANNTCSNKSIGIYLVHSGSSTVENNTCNNNWGIYIWYSRSSTVANNSFTNCGLYIFEDTIYAYLSYTVENNWVSGKKLGFYTNLDSTTINEPVYGQLIVVNCTDVTVSNQILNNATIGLFLYSCTSSVIINNTCSNNRVGIYLRSSGSSTVANNTCNHNYNNYDYNNYGIYLQSSGSSTVTNNTCNNNREGITLYSSFSSTVVINTCNHNLRGIVLLHSDYCVVTYNLLQENEEYGVYLDSISDNNIIHHNNFVDNNLGGTSQACDNGTDNYWYDTATLEGNYWSDWSGTGYYYIDGEANSVDLYPLNEPVVVEYPQIVLLILILSIVTLLLTRIISKKAKKK